MVTISCNEYIKRIDVPTTGNVLKTWKAEDETTTRDLLYLPKLFGHMIYGSDIGVTIDHLSMMVKLKKLFGSDAGKYMTVVPTEYQ
jgi:hypothetical protein